MQTILTVFVIPLEKNLSSVSDDELVDDVGVGGKEKRLLSVEFESKHHNNVKTRYEYTCFF